MNSPATLEGGECSSRASELRLTDCLVVEEFEGLRPTDPVRCRRISLRYQVTDALSPRATHVRIIVRNRKGTVVKRLGLPDAPIATWRSAKWTPRVRGTYKYFVFAKDESGNRQTTVGAARIMVR